jgi:hypothetical protein
LHPSANVFIPKFWYGLSKILIMTLTCHVGYSSCITFKVNHLGHVNLLSSQLIASLSYIAADTVVAAWLDFQRASGERNSPISLLLSAEPGFRASLPTGPT